MRQAEWIRGSCCTSDEMNAYDEDEAHGILEGDEAPPHDLIKCGECNTDFALADIVKFIDHKRKCYPRTDHIQQGAPPEEGEDGADATLGKTDTNVARESTETMEEDKEEVAIIDVVVRSEKPKIITPFKRISSTSSMQRDLISPRVKQTQTQTSDPDQSKTYICYSCKDLFENAASLLEHVQCDHGMQIYQQPWKNSESNSTLSDCSSRCSTEAKTPRKTHTPESPDSDVTAIPPPSSSSSSSSTSNAIPLPPPPLPPPIPAVSMSVSSSVTAPPSIHHPPLLVHSPHAHLPVHSLDGNPLSMFMRPPTNERHMYHSGPVNPGSCVTLREVLAPEHSNMERVGLNSHLMMQGYEHNSHHTFSPTNPSIVEANIDLYSQRLRELAAAGPMMHPKKKGFHYPVFAPRFKSPFSPKVKACEFCGKTFKFQSNLIVHRRSHTGEKPYKCQLCDHACSQASKLKRHMKTHINKPPSTLTSPSSEQQSLGDEASGGETSASSLIKTAVDRYMSESKYSSKDTSVDDEEEEEEEEGEEEFETEEEELEDEDENVGENSSDAEGLSQNPGEDQHGEKENHSSLLSEVMKHTGLSEIQQYSEAYRQAIAERYVNRRHLARIEEHGARQTPDRHPNELGSGEETLKNVLAGTSYQDHEKESAYLRQSPSLSPRNAMMGLEQVTKRIKIEPSSSTWASESSSLPCKDPFIHSPGHPSESSPSTSATNGTLSIYYSRSNATNTTERASHSSPSSGTLPYSSLGVRKSPKQEAMDRRSGTCEYCGKVFKNCSNLTVHRRSHTGEKPYKCKLCPYACAQSSKLTRHMKTHGHGAKEVFKCEVCGMPFSVYSTLEKHMKKNHWGNIRGTSQDIKIFKGDNFQN